MRYRYSIIYVWKIVEGLVPNLSDPIPCSLSDRRGRTCIVYHVVVVCPLQPSSSVNSGCPGPESSILVSSRWACPISSQVTDHWGELRNRTDEVHPVDPFHSLDILKNHSASVAFCRKLIVYHAGVGRLGTLKYNSFIDGDL